MNAIAQLEQEWLFLVQRPLPTALLAWRRRQPALRPFGSPQQLLRFLHEQPTERTDAPLLALLALARRDRLAARFTLQAILPALNAEAARLRYRPSRREEADELLLFTAWEVICTHPRRCSRLVAHSLVLRIVRQTGSALRRPDYRPRRTAAKPVPTVSRRRPRPPLRPRESTGGVVRVALVAAAVSAGVIAERDADLLVATRVEDADLQLLAQRLSVPRETLLKRRQRAEQALRAWPDLQANVRGVA